MKKGTPKSTIIALGILLVGVASFVLLMALRPEPPKVERPHISPMVTTVAAVSRHGHLTVSGTGTVRPTREVNLGAEVAGKVIALSPMMVSGGMFQRGRVLVQLDTTDYANAVAIAEAEVTQRRYELLRAREERDIAAQEWSRLEARTGEKPPMPQSDLGSMVLKEPQLKLAEALLKSAEARLSDARTRLARTHIRAPFDGRVRTKNVEVGQYVAPGQVVAALFSTDDAEIAVPFSSENAALISGLWGQEPGHPHERIPATVHAGFGGRQYTWEGVVDRTEGTLDTGTRTLNVVVKVAHPYRSNDTHPPLLVGTFARVEIQGGELAHYVSIPRAALREGDIVWIVEGDRLRMRSVEVAQTVDDRAIIRDGLDGGEQVVMSKLDVVADSMTVRVAQ